MPLYFFDIVNGGQERDDTGTECADDAEVEAAAKRALPDIAREQIPGNGNRRFFTVVVRDESRHAVYTATLSYAGMWLRDGR